MLSVFAFLACGPKEPPQSPEPVQPVEPVEVAAPEAPPEPELPPEPPKPVSNVDFNVKLTYSDGSVKEEIIRLERSEGFMHGKGMTKTVG